MERRKKQELERQGLARYLRCGKLDCDALRLWQDPQAPSPMGVRQQPSVPGFTGPHWLLQPILGGQQLEA